MTTGRWVGTGVVTSDRGCLRGSRPGGPLFWAVGAPRTLQGDAAVPCVTLGVPTSA